MGSAVGFAWALVGEEQGDGLHPEGRDRIETWGCAGQTKAERLRRFVKGIGSSLGGTGWQGGTEAEGGTKRR